MNIAQKYSKRLEQLATDRRNFENVWQSLSDYFQPHNANITNIKSQGDNTNRNKIFDDTGSLAAAYLTAEIHSGMTNPATEWLSLKLSGTSLSTGAANDLLAFFQKSLLNLFNSSNSCFQLQNHEFISSCVVYGTGCMFVDDAIQEGVKFSCIPIWEIYAAEDQYGCVDSVIRKYKQTLRQLVQRYGEDKIPSKYKNDIKDKPDRMIDVMHIVVPKEDESSIVPPLGQDYIGFTCVVGEDDLLQTSFYFENPYVVARFSKVSGEVYGRSPAWQCLPSNKGLQVMTESILKGAQLAVQPPLLTADDGVMMPLKAGPNSIIIGGLENGVPRVQPLNIGNQLNIGIDLLNRASKAIRDAFFVDQLVFRDTGTMTATEVVQRQQEALKLLLPYIGRLSTEYLLPLISRSLSIKIRNGEFGAPNSLPKELLTDGYEVIFTGTLATLQKQVTLSKFNQFVQYLGPIAQVNPQSLMMIDTKTIIRHLAEETGVWNDTLHTEEEIAIMEQAAQQAQQAQQAMGAMGAIADINQKASAGQPK